MAHNVNGKPAEFELQRVGLETKMAYKLGCREMFWVCKENRM